MLSPNDIDLLTSKIVEGVDAQSRMLNYHDFLLTTFHPSPPSDATANVRDPTTRFEQTDTSVKTFAMPTTPTWSMRVNAISAPTIVNEKTNRETQSVH